MWEISPQGAIECWGVPPQGALESWGGDSYTKDIRELGDTSTRALECWGILPQEALESCGIPPLGALESWGILPQGALGNCRDVEPHGNSNHIMRQMTDLELLTTPTWL